MKKISGLFFVSLLGCLLLLGASTTPTFAHEVQSSATGSIPSSHTTYLHFPSAVHPRSVTYDCDQGTGSGIDPIGGIPCDVASNATPCLRVHSSANFNTIVECVPPGTTLYLFCTSNLAYKGASYDVLGNSYWDNINLGSSQGIVADAYMDTTWDPSIDGPDLIPCGG